MKRQKVRKAIILISFIFFPVTLYYLSPYLPIQAGLEGAVSGSLLLFAVLFLSSLFFGRAFCSWVCPVGGLSDCCTVVSGKRFKGGRRNWIKYFVWVPWLSVVILILAKNGVKELSPFFYTDNGISATGLPGYMMYFTVVGLILVMSFVSGKRSFCHSLCWMAPFMVIGSKLKNRLRYPSLHLACDAAKCSRCRLCTGRCPMSLEVSELVQKGKLNDPECILCGECADACNKGAIRFEYGYSGSDGNRHKPSAGIDIGEN